MLYLLNKRCKQLKKFILARIRIQYRISRKINQLFPPKNCYITCLSKKDGIGAQTQAKMSTILYAHDFGLQYVHTPFKKISHNLKNNSKWEEICESFFNLGDSEKKIEDINLENLNVVKLNQLKRFMRKKNTLYVVKHCHHYVDRFPDNYLNLINKFSKKYYLSDKDKYANHFNSKKINIAIHIRRGDVSSNKNKKRYTSNKKIILLLKKILLIFEELSVETSVHIYSQGILDDFEELKEMDLEFHLNNSLFTTFNSLVSTDMLIMAKSSFSYIAALFSKGIIIYEPFHHSKLSHWIKMDNRLNFDEKLLKDRVSKQLIQKNSKKEN